MDCELVTKESQPAYTPGYNATSHCDKATMHCELVKGTLAKDPVNRDALSNLSGRRRRYDFEQVFAHCFNGAVVRGREKGSRSGMFLRITFPATTKSYPRFGRDEIS